MIEFLRRLLGVTTPLESRDGRSSRSTGQEREQGADPHAELINGMKTLAAKSGKRLRDPLYQDATLVIDALKRTEIPEEHHESFVRFQSKFGGLQDHFGLNRVVWGIIHPSPEWYDPGEVDAEQDDEEESIWHVICADVHPSDTLTIDQNGALYWSWSKWFDHYEDYFEEKFPKGVS